MKSVKISLHRNTFRILAVFCKKNKMPLRTAIRQAQDFFILFYGQESLENICGKPKKRNFTKPKVQIQHAPVNEFFLTHQSGFSKSVLVEMVILVFIKNLSASEALNKAFTRPLKNTKLYEA